jgi:chromosome segregation ATPase
MKERLDLLKEIGGTSVYEDKRKESLKIMEVNPKPFNLKL